jgi:hypothetical protein
MFGFYVLPHALSFPARRTSVRTTAVRKFYQSCCRLSFS